MTRPASRLDRWEAATRRRLSGPVAFLVFGELRLAQAIWQAASGRPDVAEGEAGIGYARGRLPVDLIFAGLAVLELVAVDLLVPWERLGDYGWIRMVVLLTSVCGLLWIALWMVSERTRPHLATNDALVLRWGHLPIATVPWTDIRDVRVHRRYSGDGDRLTHDVPLQGTNLDLELHQPLDAKLPFKHHRKHVTGISLGVDDPEAAARLISAHIHP